MRRINNKFKDNIIIVFFIILLALFFWIIWGNITVQTTKFKISSDNIPKSFVGYKIAQISDLHNAELGKNNSRLINILKNEQPDIIAITGDIIDSNHTNVSTAINFAKEAVKIAPCYYVTGNHEAWIKEDYLKFEHNLIECGVTVLRNSSVKLSKGNDYINLIGIDDPDFSESSTLFNIEDGIISTEIENTCSACEANSYKILLSHRPETFDIYASKNIDLALCGHAHGGQVRLPFIGGIIAPNQGLFPKYDAGVYSEGDTTMVVSRGIGNSIIPIRINNRPEVVIVTLSD